MSARPAARQHVERGGECSLFLRSRSRDRARRPGGSSEPRVERGSHPRAATRRSARYGGARAAVSARDDPTPTARGVGRTSRCVSGRPSMSRNRREGLARLRKNARGAVHERPEPDRARRRAGIRRAHPSLASRGDDVRSNDSRNAPAGNRRAEPGTTSHHRASPSRVDRTRAPRPRLARAFFAISSQVPSTLLRVTPSQRSRARARVTSARPTCRARPPSSAARWGSPCRCTSTPCASSPLLRSASPPPARRRAAAPSRSSHAGASIDARADPEVERFEHPDANVEPRRTSARDAFVRARPARDARRGVERPRGSGSVDATAVSSGAIVGADVNASEAWRVAGAAYYDTQRTIPGVRGQDARRLPIAGRLPRAPEEPRTGGGGKPKPRAAYSADQLRRMNVGCEAAPAGMDFDREEARADVDAEVGTDADAEVGTVADADVDANADADAGSTPPPRTSTPPRASAAAAPSTAREENPPPATSPRTSWPRNRRSSRARRRHLERVSRRRAVPAPATEETRDEKDETKTEEEPPARTARPRRAAAAAAAHAAAAVCRRRLEEEEEGCADEDAETRAVGGDETSVEARRERLGRARVRAQETKSSQNFGRGRCGRSRAPERGVRRETDARRAPAVLREPRHDAPHAPRLRFQPPSSPRLRRCDRKLLRALASGRRQCVVAGARWRPSRSAPRRLRRPVAHAGVREETPARGLALAPEQPPRSRAAPKVKTATWRPARPRRKRRDGRGPSASPARTRRRPARTRLRLAKAEETGGRRRAGRPRRARSR